MKNGKTDVVELLLSNGANVNVTDKKGTTPLALAKRGSRHQIIELLIKHGAPPPTDHNLKNKGKKVPPAP